ncbi:uncharacterized protein LOC114305899 [Camellia sinensis]|uniref:uncharacterized protein LOC114305899 n=1 Tax=Camellia sinensis TaxID=4442 RepID=UPI00103605A1|nr:uncharacterized protein LOC114305899 [Camellia sinensis]
MPGVDPEVVMHCLNVDPKAKPVVQRSHHSTAEHASAVIEEVDKLLEAKIIREVTYPMSQYRLPDRSNRGVPPVKYEPDPKSKVKYPVGNHVSSKRLSESYASYLNTVRVLLSLAVNRDWKLLQFDVKNAFLHGDLKEEVFMDPPPGIEEYANVSMSNLDHTLFLKHRKGKITALIIYVDDMVMTGDDQEEMENLQRHLASKFEMKQLGDLKYFLGIEVARSKNDAAPTNQARYQRLVGKLIYLSHTRPDIAYAVGVTSQFMHDPRKPHMDAVERILRYLKSAPRKGLLFTKNDRLKVEGYTDADWAGSANDRRSTSGYFTFVEGNLVTWKSKKQPVVARSSAETEYKGMALGVCELL